jgi:hypothetical protein
MTEVIEGDHTAHNHHAHHDHHDERALNASDQGSSERESLDTYYIFYWEAVLKGFIGMVEGGSSLDGAYYRSCIAICATAAQQREREWIAMKGRAFMDLTNVYLRLKAET